MESARRRLGLRSTFSSSPPDTLIYALGRSALTITDTRPITVRENDSASNTEMTREGSDSNSINNTYWPNKRLRNDNPSSPAKFKGVVLQQNGHWGAQIYTNHQRIWLGTFKLEKEAAMAYDSAAIKLRSGDSHRNFQWTSVTNQEPSFQELFSSEEVLNMIKDGSYESKFADYIRTRSSDVTFDGLLDLKGGFVYQGAMCQLLFQKEMTPSDVGKLNRLVIPKKHAIKFFLALTEGSAIREESSGDGGSGEEVEFEFFDNSMRSWKFRYCYWKSSQSFVFTRGWNRFVKDKQLRAKDVVAFYECRCAEVSNVKKSFLMIDVVSDTGGENVSSNGIDRDVGSVGQDLELQLGLGGLSECGAEYKGSKVNEETEEELAGTLLTKKTIKLFGTEIIN